MSMSNGKSNGINNHCVKNDRFSVTPTKSETDIVITGCRNKSDQQQYGSIQVPLNREPSQPSSSRNKTSSQNGTVHLSLTRAPSLSRSAAGHPDKMPKLTRNELLSIASVSFGNFCLGTLYALLAPFFPYEAEQKGVSPTQYGFVFGVFEFGQFVFAPLAGRFIPHLTTRLAITGGLFTTSLCTTLFAGLQWCPSGWTYFWVAFMLRACSAVGAAFFFTAAFTLIATDFQERISALFSLTEMFFGFGMIVGPSIGGLLFEYGGFACPFFVTGVAGFIATLFAFLFLPKKPTPRSEKKVSLLSLITKLGVFVNILIVFTSFINVGFNDATLEHHLRDVTTLTPTAVGGIFLVSGILYATTTQGWGILIQKFGRAHFFVITGYLCSALCFVLCGPMFPLNTILEPSLTLVIVAQVLYGISTGPQLVGSFTEGLAETVKAGFPDDVTTSAAMSSIYQAACALGASIGPVIGGVMMDHWGYKRASTVFVSLQLAMIAILMGFNFWRMTGAKKSESSVTLETSTP